MSAQEMNDFAAHLVQLSTHAGQSLTDVLNIAPDEQKDAVRQMREAARAFYRSAKEFSRHVDGSGEL